MKVSSTSILSLVLALNGVIASPLRARDYVTVTELATEYVHVTSTTWVDPAEYIPTAVPTAAPDPDEKKKNKNHVATSAPSVSISETLALPIVSSTISELSVVPSSTLAYSSVETTQQTTLSIPPTSVSSTSTTISTPSKSPPTTTSSTSSISTPSTTIKESSTTLQTSTLPAPITPTPPPIKAEPSTTAPVPVPSAPVGGTPNVGGSTGGGGSVSHTGEGTFYDPALGSCGIVSSSSDPVCAISHLLMDAKKTADPNKNPLCGSTILVSYNGGKQVPVKIVDRCVGCAQDDLDLSPSAFEAMGADKNAGRVKIAWGFA